MVYALIAANIGVFAVELASGAGAFGATPQHMLQLGGNFAPLTLHGQWWRLGSSMFLHLGVLHLGLNMLCLYNARIVEAVFGHVGFVAIYLVAGLGGGIASLVAGPADAVTVGASGAVFGVYGAFGAVLVLRRSQIEVETWRRTARSLASFLVLNLVIGLSMAGISVSAHVGGLIVGFAIGTALLLGTRAMRSGGSRA
jgi:rhomboid protease GluP